MSAQNKSPIPVFAHALLGLCTPVLLRCGMIAALLGASPSLVESKEPNPHKLYVLLHNGSVLSGYVHRVGDQVSISEQDGSTLRISASEISIFASSMKGIYQHRRDQRIDGDLKGLHADIRWSLRHGLIREAAQDALLAKRLAPSDVTTKQLIGQVALRMREESHPNRSPQRLPSVRTVSHEQPLGSRMGTVGDETTSAPSEQPLGHPELPGWISEQTRILFITRVQPILTNRCASCHSRSKSLTNDAPVDSFQLHQPATVRWAAETSATENLLSLLGQVDLQSTPTSRLRAYCLDEHGGRQASLGPEDSAMMKNLDRWLEMLASDYERKRRTDQILGPDPSNEEIEDSDSNAEAPAEAGQFRGEGVESQAKSASGRVRRMPQIENPFDPSIFNRRYHGLDSNGDERNPVDAQDS